MPAFFALGPSCYSGRGSLGEPALLIVPITVSQSEVLANTIGVIEGLRTEWSGWRTCIIEKGGRPLLAAIPSGRTILADRLLSALQALDQKTVTGRFGR